MREKQSTISYLGMVSKKPLKGQDAYDNLHFANDEVLSELHYINFKKIVPHNWKKLQAIWKHLNSKYKAALNCFTFCSMHLSKFFEFCNGRHEIYYLRKPLESKPDLVATVVADLPEELFLECCNRPSSTISLSSKRKREKDSVIVEALCELWTSHMEVELLKQKLALMQHQDECLSKDEECLQKEEEWKAAENFFRKQDEAHKATDHLFKQKDDACKAAEHLFKQQEEARKAREHIFNEWERIQLNIRELSRALLICDMESDIVVLINKKQLSDRLNIN